MDSMYEMGMYLNDMALHDSSRDLVLAGTQQQAEMKLMLAQVTSSSSSMYWQDTK